METLPILLFTAVLGLSLWLMHRPRQRVDPAPQRTQSWLDLRPCTSETDALLETLQHVENCPGSHYKVSQARSGNWNGVPVYFARVTRTRGEHSVTFGVLLGRVARRGEHAALYLKPSTFTGTSVDRTLRAMTPEGWDAAVESLQPLECTGVDLGEVVEVHGPAGASVRTILDPATLQALHGAGDAGALKILLRDGWCAFFMPSPHLPVDLDLLRPIVLALAARREPESRLTPTTARA